MAPASAILSGGGLFWGIVYSVTSVAITLFNKAIFSHGFPSAMALTLMQGVVTIVGCQVLKWTGSPQMQFPDLNWRTVAQVAPLSFVFIAYVVISLMGLSAMNLPMFTSLRRLTIVFVMVEEMFLFGRRHSPAIVNTVVVMCIGAAIAAWKDLTFDLYAYWLLFLTNLFTSLYTVYVAKVRKDTGLSPAGMLFYCNVSSMPVLLVLAWFSGDLHKAWAFKLASGDSHFAFQFNFWASVFTAFLMNVSVFYNTVVTSARTQTVIGQLKNFVAFLLGLVLFSDYIYDPLNMFGLIVGLAGSVWYAYVEYVDKENAAAAAAAASGGANVLPTVAPTKGDGSASGAAEASK